MAENTDLNTTLVCSYDDLKEGNFASIVSSQQDIPVLIPHHPSAIKLNVCLPYSDKIGWDNAIQVASKIAGYQEEYLRNEKYRTLVKYEDSCPSVTTMITQIFDLITATSYANLFKLVSTYAV